MKGKSLSRVRLLATPWTAAHQAPPSMGFSRQKYWCGVPLPSPKLRRISSDIVLYSYVLPKYYQSLKAACTICSTLSYLQALATQWTVAHQASLSLSSVQFSRSVMSDFFFFFTLQYCIGFAIHQHASAMGIHVFPILNPPTTSLMSNSL